LDRVWLNNKKDVAKAKELIYSVFRSEEEFAPLPEVLIFIFLSHSRSPSQLSLVSSADQCLDSP